MTVVDPAVGDLFTVRIKKFLGNNPDRIWSNTYEIQAKEGANESNLITWALNLVSFEVQLHAGQVRFTEVLVSTWEADSKPYNPATFISLPLNAQGARTGSGNPVGAATTLWLARVAASGRPGKLFYRSCLYEADIDAPSGRTTLVDFGGIGVEVTDALGVSQVEEMSETGLAEYKLVMISKDGSQVRDFRNWQVKGVATVPYDHAWFNRTTTP